MDANSIDRIAQLGIDAQRAAVLNTATPGIVLRDADGRQHVESLEQFAIGRSRMRGLYSTSSLPDFARYVVARGGSGFIEPNNLTASVFFNLVIDVMQGDVATVHGTQPGHADYRARLQLTQTPAYGAMRFAHHNVFGQKQLIEWIEDWWDCLAADHPERTSADSADPSGMRAALSALRKVKIKATNEAVHTDTHFGASRSALEDVEASSDVGLPRGFRFSCKPAEDLDARAFYLRLGVRTGDDALAFVLRWAHMDSDIEAVGQDFKTKLLDAIGDKAEMLLGTFDPGK